MQDTYERFEGLPASDDMEDECAEESAKKRCKFCGTGGLHWEETDDGWRLATDKGLLHVCPKGTRR